MSELTLAQRLLRKVFVPESLPPEDEDETKLYSITIGQWTVNLRLATSQDWRTVLLLMFWAADLSAAYDERISPTVIVRGSFREGVIYEGTLDALATSMGQF